MPSHPGSPDARANATAKAKASDLGTGGAARAAAAGANRSTRIAGGADAALAAFRRAQGLPTGQGQSTDSNQ